jgi:copper homeostasis protein
MNIFLIECCANSVQSAINGQIAGANRIELCCNLEVGGLTPSREEITKALGILNIPIRILIRPRSGNFVFSKQELSQMIANINFCKTIGCEGIVIGALNKNNSINIEQTKVMVKAAKPMHITFHRAFDEANNLEENLEDVIACGCDSILTAGQSTNVIDGIANLKKLIRLANNRIHILAGSGVNHTNVEALYKIGIRNFHLSGSEKTKSDILETNSINIQKLITKLTNIA